MTFSPVPFTENPSLGVDMSLEVRLVVPFLMSSGRAKKCTTFFSPSKTGFRHLKNVFPGGILRRV